MANFAFESLAPDRPQDESWIDHGEIEHFKRLLLLLLLSLLSRRPVTKFRHRCDDRDILFRLSSRIWVQVGSCRFGALSNFRQKMSHNENPTLWNIYFRTVWTHLKSKFTLGQHWNVLTIFWLCPSFSEGGKIINILVSHPVQRFCRGKIKTASGNKFKHSELILATYDFSKIESNYMYERIDRRKIYFYDDDGFENRSYEFNAHETISGVKVPDREESMPNFSAAWRRHLSGLGKKFRENFLTRSLASKFQI